MTRGPYGADASGLNGNAETWRNSETGGGALSVNGLRAQSNNYQLDDLNNNDALINTIIFFPPVEATQHWFHGKVTDHTRTSSNFATLVDPHASRQASYDVTDGWFSNSKPDLNQENPFVETYLIQNAVWWVDSAGLDGLRLDTFPYVPRAFWRDFHATLHELYPHLTTVGEIFNHPRQQFWFDPVICV